MNLKQVDSHAQMISRTLPSLFQLKFSKTPLLVIFIFCNACAPKLQQFEAEENFNIYTYSKSFINIHYVEVGDKTLLIDCGNVGDSAKIENYFSKQGLDLADVDFLIITHGHADHVGNAQYFKEKYGMQIIAGAAEQEMIHNHGDDPELCLRSI